MEVRRHAVDLFARSGRTGTNLDLAGIFSHDRGDESSLILPTNIKNKSNIPLNPSTLNLNIARCEEDPLRKRVADLGEGGANNWFRSWRQQRQQVDTATLDSGNVRSTR